MEAHIENLFVSNIWLAVAVGALLYAADYVLTLFAIRLYQANARNDMAVEGRPDFTSFFEPDAAARRRRNTRFLLAVILIAFGILAMWELLVEQSNRPEIFAFLMGGLFLLYLAACLQDLRDIMLFRFVRNAREKKIGFSERFYYSRTALELGIFAVICGLLFLMTTSWFFLGGAVTCFVSGRRRRDWAMISR